MSAPSAYCVGRGDDPPKTPPAPGGTHPPRPPLGGLRPPDLALHPGDELLDALVHRAERVLAQHGPLGLVVQLEVHPVDGEVAPLLLGPADELAAQLGPRRL